MDSPVGAHTTGERTSQRRDDDEHITSCESACFYFLAFGSYKKVLDRVSSLLLSLLQAEDYNSQSATADIIAWEKSHGRDSPGGHDAG
jgi:hypothetical protein